MKFDVDGRREDGVRVQRHSLICDPWTHKLVPNADHPSGVAMVVDHLGDPACAGCPRARPADRWNVVVPPGEAYDHLRVRWDNPRWLPPGAGRVLPSGEEVVANLLFVDADEAARFVERLEADPRPFPRMSSGRT